MGGVAAWAQAPADAVGKKVDRASAYYHYTLAHMYAEMASNYNGRPLPAEVFISEGRVVAVAERGDVDAWIAGRLRR